MIAYSEGIVQTSESAERRQTATRVIANVTPLLEQLEAAERERVERLRLSTEAARADAGDEFEPVWNGAIGRAGKSLTEAQGMGSSLGASGFVLRT